MKFFMNIANDWKDYELLDMAGGEKLERWKDYILIRPDPQIIWKEKSFPEIWKTAHARYNRSSKRTEEDGNIIKNFLRVGRFLIKI